MNTISQLMCYFLKILFVYLFEDLIFETPKKLGSHSTAFVLAWTLFSPQSSKQCRGTFGPNFPQPH